MSPFNEDADFGRRLLEGVGASHGAVYVSGCITSGRRELDLMRRLKCNSRAELRDLHPAEHRREVILLNELDIRKYALQVRGQNPKKLVINPGTLYKSGWSQRDYMTFWTTVISQLVLSMVLTPGWAYSAGAREEVQLALATLVELRSLDGRILSVTDLAKADQSARQRMTLEGWSAEFIRDYLPPINFVRVLESADRFAESEALRLAGFITEHNERSRSAQKEL